MNTSPPFRSYVSGSGPALIALHGWGSSALALSPLTVLLAHQFRIHSIDLPGFGGSLAPATAWDTNDYAAAVADYIKENTPDGAHVLGHSFGAQVALQLALTEPLLVKAIILIAAPVAPVERTAWQWLRYAGIGMLRRACKAMARVMPRLGKISLEWHNRHYGSIDYKRATNPRMREILVRIIRDDRPAIYARLHEIDHRVLLLWGDADTATPAYMAKRLHDRLSHSALTLLPGKDHFPFSGFGADLCAQKILDFLSAETPHHD